MSLPYEKAKLELFETVVKKATKHKVKCCSHETLDEESLAARVVEKILPSLNEIIQNAIQNAISSTIQPSFKLSPLIQQPSSPPLVTPPCHLTPTMMDSPHEPSPVDVDTMMTQLEPSIHDDLMKQALETIQSITKEPNANWTGEGQKHAMAAVLEKRTDVMAIMCTGSGKSMLFVVPSIIERNSITVVVVPLKSLTMAS